MGILDQVDAFIDSGRIGHRVHPAQLVEPQFQRRRHLRVQFGSRASGINLYNVL